MESHTNTHIHTPTLTAIQKYDSARRKKSSLEEKKNAMSKRRTLSSYQRDSNKSLNFVLNRELDIVLVQNIVQALEKILALPFNPCTERMPHVSRKPKSKTHDTCHEEEKRHTPMIEIQIVALRTEKNRERGHSISANITLTWTRITVQPSAMHNLNF